MTTRYQAQALEAGGVVEVVVERQHVYDHPDSAPACKVSTKRFVVRAVLDDGRVLLRNDTHHAVLTRSREGLTIGSYKSNHFSRYDVISIRCV